ncbi:MAG: DUF484 family protein [Candidatus Schmidhempelia sp.]|nr:DUF484 family protein [Candidatus Schmidhempelia sp.]
MNIDISLPLNKDKQGKVAKSLKNELTIDNVHYHDRHVCEYLLKNPDFFIHHAQKLEALRIPHPVRGAVSLPEWIMARQRKKIQQLEQEIQHLIDNATMNQKLFEQLIFLQLELLKANDIDELTHRLNSWAKSIGLQGAYIYLFDDKWQLSAPLKFQHLALSSEKFEFIRISYLQYSQQYLGQLNAAECALLLPDQHYVGSVALSLLGQFGDLGILVFSSRHPNHYQPEQGTLLLEKISQILPILISRWINRKDQ